MSDPIELFFEVKSEHRGWYTESYMPPTRGGFFAILTLKILDHSNAKKIAGEMEARSKWWYSKYRMPVMTMVSRQGSMPTGIKEFKGIDYLVAFSRKNDGHIELFWKSMPDESYPQSEYSNGKLIRIYHDFKSETGNQLRSKIEGENKSLKLFITLVRIATIFVPAIWLLYQELFSPEWFAYIILAYGLAKYGREYLVCLGVLKRTKKEIEKAERKRIEEHYVYHCESNPEGFQQLKNENFKRNVKERDAKRVQDLLDEKEFNAPSSETS